MRTPEVWSQTDVFSRICLTSLWPFGAVYGATIALRARMARPLSVPAKVVCVGSIVAGGTGKTPVAIAIAGELQRLGRRVVLLSRGYGGNAKGPRVVDPVRDSAFEVGDEPLLLAKVSTTVVARDRRSGAALALALGAEVIVMDDGHQNFALRKDLSIVVVDASNPSGNGRVLPAGPLREPVNQGLSRADLVVVTGESAGESVRASVPVLHARIVANDRGELFGQRVLAFAGIGQPGRFFATLRRLGAFVICSRQFADHHVYSSAEISQLKADARREEAKLVTTEKDFVRLVAEESADIDVLRVKAKFDDQTALTEVLAGLLGMSEKEGM